MSVDVIKRFVLFFIMCLVQVLLLNHFHLLGVATPLFYVYFVVTFRRGYPRWASMLWSFALGLTIDTFSNTTGLATSSLTLIAFLQPYLLELFVPRDAAEDMHCSRKALGSMRFFWLAGIITMIYCFTFFTLEAFGFFDFFRWLMCIIGSFVLTLLLVFVAEELRISEKL